MELNKWLDAEVGRSARLASHFGLTPSAVTQWRTNGVPVHRMKAVRDFSHGEVSIEEMIPDFPASQQPADQAQASESAANQAQAATETVASGV